MEQPMSPEQLERGIEELLDALRTRYDAIGLYHFLEQPMQDEWYDVEMQAEVGRDRAQAKIDLALFLEKLEAEKIARGL